MGPVFFLGFLLILSIYGYEAISGRTIKIKINKTNTKIILLGLVFLWAGYWIVRMLTEI